VNQWKVREVSSLNKKILKILYFVFNGFIGLIGIGILRRYIPFTDDYFNVKILGLSIAIIVVSIAHHLAFTRLIFGEEKTRGRTGEEKI
jgi:hypothetical protein